MAEEEKEEKPAAADDGVPEPKSKKKLIMIIAGAVVLAAAAGGGAFFMLGGSDDAAKMSAEAPITPMAEGGEKADAAEKKAEGDKDAGEHADQPTGKAEGEAEAKGAPEAVSEEDYDFGDSFKLDTFNLNLGNPLENRYIRLDVAIEYKGGEAQKKELVKRTPQIRDVVVTVVSRKTREFLLSPDGKGQLRKELLTRINRYMSRPVESVYITDILIE